MARQKSPFKISGSIAGISFYETSDGYFAREKSDMGNKVKNHASFERTRENMAEFGAAAKASKLFRDTFRLLLQRSSDGHMHSRLHQAMVKVLQSDTQSLRGERKPSLGDHTLLQGFEFNRYSNLNSTLFMPYTAGIDRATGLASVSVAESIPKSQIVAPDGATHYKLVVAAAAIDFENSAVEPLLNSSDYRSVSDFNAAALKLDLQLAANSVLPLFLLFGVDFYQITNGKHYPLNAGAFNSLSLVKVAGA